MEYFKEYDDKEILEKLKAYELGIFKDFSELCEKHGIDYFACGGTTIGIARHNGFIPWDDDIDLGLTRKNYEKFLKIAPKELSEKYKVINAETTKNYPLMTTRLALKGTRFKEECYKNLDIDNGIFLDLFCFDNIPDDDKRMKRQGISAWFWAKILVLLYIDEPVIYVKGAKATITRIACKMAHKLFKLLKVSPEKIYKRAKRIASAFKDQKTKRIAYMFDPSPYTSIMNIDDVEPTVFREFEGIPMRCPCNMEKYMADRYGDYMTLPPEEDRHNHPPYELDFGEENK